MGPSLSWNSLFHFARWALSSGWAIAPEWLPSASFGALQASESKTLSKLCARHFRSVSDGLSPVLHYISFQNFVLDQTGSRKGFAFFTPLLGWEDRPAAVFPKMYWNLSAWTAPHVPVLNNKCQTNFLQVDKWGAWVLAHVPHSFQLAL